MANHHKTFMDNHHVFLLWLTITVYIYFVMTDHNAEVCFTKYHQITKSQSLSFAYVHHLMIIMSAFPNARNMRTVRIDWSVKGYHHFKIRPHPDITMLVEREDGNRYDPFAMKVMMPTLDRIPRNLHGVVTRPQNQRHHQSQTVAEIAGKYPLHFKLANRC